MKKGQSLYDVASRVITRMRDVLNGCSPDIVLVHGVTTTSTATAMAAFYKQIYLDILRQVSEQIIYTVHGLKRLINR